ncbi:MAG: hypothetical protein QM831_40780 [Kofleriaceae bacterium]
MRTWFLVLALGCGGPGPSTPPTTPAPSVADTNTPEAIGKEFAQAALLDNTEKAKRLTLTYDELVEMSTNAPTKEEYEQLRDSALKEMSGGGRKVKVTQTAVVKQQTLPAGDKLKHAVDIAYVQFAIDDDGEVHEVGFPLLFIKVGGTWKWSPKQ